MRLSLTPKTSEFYVLFSKAAENALRGLGFRVCRVRHHDELARIELGRDEMPRAFEPELSSAIVAAVKAAGYRYVTIDLLGYRTGSLNEGLILTPADHVRSSASAAHTSELGAAAADEQARG